MYKNQKSRTSSLPPPAHSRGLTFMGPKDHDRNVVSGRARTHKAAFTLIELIVVMAVIGVLVLLAAPKFLNYTARARETHIRNDIKVLESKIDEYLINHGTLPEEWKTGGSKQGKKCSLLTFEKDGPVPINLSDIEQLEAKYPSFAGGLIGGFYGEVMTGFYKTKIDGDEVVYFYVYDKTTDDFGSTTEVEMFISLDDFEPPQPSEQEGVQEREQVYPAYIYAKIDGEDFPISDFLVSNMSKDLLPKYYARYDDDSNVIDDHCFQDRESVSAVGGDDSPTLTKLFKDSESSSSEGITGKLYDKTGPIGSMPPGNFQLVDRPFYPESKLDGNFYANNDGVVIYEDTENQESGDISINNERPIALAINFLLTNKNLYALSYDSGKYIPIQSDKWSNVTDIKTTTEGSVAVFTDTGTYLVEPLINITDEDILEFVETTEDIEFLENPNGDEIIEPSNTDSYESRVYQLEKDDSGNYYHTDSQYMLRKRLPEEITGEIIGMLYSLGEDDSRIGNLHYVTKNNVWIDYVGTPPR